MTHPQPHPLAPIRRRFRQTLYVLLALSFLFAGTMSAAFVLTRNKIVTIQQLSPALFEADILGHQTRALFQTEDQKFSNAADLIRKTFFSLQYLAPARSMMRELAYNNYPPAQYVHANLIMLTAPDTGRGEAMMFYQDAADKGYEPAQVRLAEIAGLEPLRTESR
jgi:hypothetical protein